MSDKKYAIVDIDGTITKPGERLKYLQQEPKDWDSFYADCFDDEPHDDIVELVRNLIQGGQYEVVFCTGRRERCREKTEQWLYSYLEFRPSRETLLMRPDGDIRPDVVVKPELVVAAGIKLDEIAFVLEDRDCVVKKWRELGVRCLQVAEGKF